MGSRQGRHLKLFDKKTAQALLTALVFALLLVSLRRLAGDHYVSFRNFLCIYP